MDWSCTLVCEWLCEFIVSLNSEFRFLAFEHGLKLQPPYVSTCWGSRELMWEPDWNSALPFIFLYETISWDIHVYWLQTYEQTAICHSALPYKTTTSPHQQKLPSACRIFFAYHQAPKGIKTLWLQNSAQAVFTFMSCGCHLSGHGHPRSAYAKRLVRSASWWASASLPCSRVTEAQAICRTGSVYSGG
jgi:hypothetical protein